MSFKGFITRGSELTEDRTGYKYCLRRWKFEHRKKVFNLCDRRPDTVQLNPVSERISVVGHYSKLLQCIPNINWISKYIYFAYKKGEGVVTPLSPNANRGMSGDLRGRTSGQRIRTRFPLRVETCPKNIYANSGQRYRMQKESGKTRRVTGNCVTYSVPK